MAFYEFNGKRVYFTDYLNQVKYNKPHRPEVISISNFGPQRRVQYTTNQTRYAQAYHYDNQPYELNNYIQPVNTEQSIRVNYDDENLLNQVVKPDPLQGQMLSSELNTYVHKNEECSCEYCLSINCDCHLCNPRRFCKCKLCDQSHIHNRSGLILNDSIPSENIQIYETDNQNNENDENYAFKSSSKMWYEFSNLKD